MSSFQKWGLFLLRITTGWFFFYAGLSKIINPEWSAAGYLTHATSFSGFYNWLASPSILPIINFINEWGLLLIGVALILGVGVRLAGTLGVVMMILYYFPVLDFPAAGEHGYIVDDHILWAAGLLVLAAFRAGRVWGLEAWCSSLPLCSKFPKLRSLLG
jgi:thiosulfate dehydrogenase (quinone) large subunit